MSNSVSRYVFLFALGVLASSGCIPTSLRAALMKQEDTLPPSLVLLPEFDSVHRLGTILPEGSERALSERRLTKLEPTSCFWSEPTESNSLSKIEVNYGSGAELKLDVGSVAGINLDAVRKAKLTLSDLKIIRGIGAPIPGCFSEEKRKNQEWKGKALTTSIKAATIRLAIEDNQGIGVTASIPVQKISIGGKLNWKRIGDSEFEAQDVYFAGSVTDLAVSFDPPHVIDLGPTPEVGHVWPLPSGYDGSISIIRYDSAEKELTIRINTTMGDAVRLTEKGVVNPYLCPVGQELTLKLGQACTLVQSPGTLSVNVTWGLDNVYTKLYLGYARTLIDRSKASK